MSRKFSFAFCLVFLFALMVGRISTAQSKSELPSERAAAKVAASTAKSVASLSKSQREQARSLSFRNFVRGGLASGNLIQVPYVTNLNISAGYWGGAVAPSRIQWPRNSGVEYGHTMSFMVGAEVINDSGDTLHVISDSYNRSGGDTSPTGSHKYFWNAIPGYYNMQGSSDTPNRLNDNADDRDVLQLSGNYFVGGLNEDANNNGVLDTGEDLNGNGVLDTGMVNRLENAAQSNVPQTWPAFWPPQSYVGDSRPACEFVEGSVCNPGGGVRAGRWNGAYGSYVRADQESYYRSDDRDNDEFAYYPFLNPATGQPDTRGYAEGGRRGLGLEVEARQYQWASVLAEDIFIGTFDVKNIGRKDVPKAVIAMIVDYDIGGQTGNNKALFDTEDDITYQWLKRELVINGFKVGYAGVGFLESPGINNDGIDNDSDGMVDESRQNGIDDDGDWIAWIDVNGNGVYDNEDLNNNFILDPGEDVDGDGILTIEPAGNDVGSDGLGPENEGYPGPDPDGTETNGVPDVGEPNFEFTDNDEIDQIGLTGMVIRTPSDFDSDLDDDAVFWDEYIAPGTFILPEETADVIYTYSSGFSEIKVGARQRFSIAFFAGNDFEDMLRNKRTMQNIYDSDYNFAQPPRTPFLTAVAGDGRVTLTWDQSAELSRDPIYGEDFEMYKVYRSTEPEFNDIKTITDAFGNPLLWEPLVNESGGRVQFDIKNGLSGAHPIPIGDFGVSYDMGSDTGLEYSYVDRSVDNGRTYYYCVVSVDRGYAPNFYEDGLSTYNNLASISPTESSKIIEVDAFDRPTNVARNCAVVVPQPSALGYVEPGLQDGVEQVGGDASGQLNVEFLIPREAKSGTAYEVTFTDDGSYEQLDPTLLRNGRTSGFILRNATTGDTLAASGAGDVGAGLYNSSLLRAQLYDGMKFSIDAPLEPAPIRTEWLENTNAGDRGIRRPTVSVLVSSPDGSTAVPNDYEIRIEGGVVDTSNSLGAATRMPTRFALFDVTNLNATKRMPFQFTDGAPLVPADTIAGRLSPGDAVNVRVKKIDFQGYPYYSESTWRFTLQMSDAATEVMTQARLAANALYDSLVTGAVRGMQSRPYGADIEVLELDDFFSDVDEYHDSILDSLRTVPSLQAMLGAPDYHTPREYLDEIRKVERNEIPIAGDVFLLETSKPFDRDDVLRFVVDGNRMEGALDEHSLDSIYVVPDPYVVVNSLETRNVLLSGRGERRIDFRNLPPECTIRIFTMSGRLVKTIYHDASDATSIASWNLKSDDGLDISFGVYIFHVTAPGIGERIGRFSIIK